MLLAFRILVLGVACCALVAYRAVQPPDPVDGRAAAAAVRQFDNTSASSRALHRAATDRWWETWSLQLWVLLLIAAFLFAPELARSVRALEREQV